jgi:hypothetical protein
VSLAIAKAVPPARHCESRVLALSADEATLSAVRIKPRHPIERAEL